MLPPRKSQPSSNPNADVRMRGFVDRISVRAALAWLDDVLEKQGLLTSERVTLDTAAGRVLAEMVTSTVNVPNFRRAMMDGYALHANDIAKASNENPVALEVIGECFPGSQFEGRVTAGQAVRIMTGAALPEDVDSVLPVELTKSIDSNVFALANLTEGKHVGGVGEDIRAGETVFQAGRVLRAQDIGVLSSIGHAKPQVVRRPRVRMVVTGDEVLAAGSMPEKTQIVDANGPMLAALVERDGGVPNHPGIVPDNRKAILAALESDADIILTSGGSSVGQEDHVPPLLAEYGELSVHGVAMKPGGPIGMGALHGRLVIMLPGNPVACLWGYDLFAGRAIRSCGGQNIDWPYRKTEIPLASEILSPAGRLDYVRVQLIDGQAQPVANSGSSVLSSTTKADGFLIVSNETTSLPVKSKVEVYLYG